MTTTIERVETFRVDYPVRGSFKFFESKGGKPPVRETVVVKLTTGDGVAGWGQCVPSPRWSYETIESVESTIERYLAPVLIGMDPHDETAIHRAMNRAIAPSFSTGQPICKAGIDLAVFDLAGKLLGQSAYERWERVGRDTVTLSWTLNPSSLEDAAADVATAHDRGYRHFNVKVGPDTTFDLELCKLVRQLAPQAQLWADANGGYDLDSALTVAPQLAELGFLALEQPLPAVQLSGFTRLKQQGAIPILMDEPLVSCDVLREFHKLGLLDGTAIKVSRCGGLTDARKQVEYLLDNDLHFFGSGLTDPDLSLAASLLLFSAFGLEVPAALNGPQYLDGSILKSPLIAHGDMIEVPRGAGLGVEVDEDGLNR